MTTRVPTILAVLGMTLMSAQADVFHVGPDGDHPTLQSAFAAVDALGGDNEIRIQAGLYDQNTAFPFFDSGDSLSVSGGWNSDFSQTVSDPSLTVLSGGSARRVISFNAVAGTFRLENLTIRDGFVENAGAGLNFAAEGTATVEIVNCHFIDNRAGLEDGTSSSSFAAALNADLNGQASLEIDGCLFQDNVATAAESASAVVRISASSEADTVVSNSRFLSNSSESAANSATGGALTIFIRNDSSLRLVSNHFEENSAECPTGSAIGGAVNAGASGAAILELVGNTFLNNTAISDAFIDAGAVSMNVFGSVQGLFQDNILIGNTTQGESDPDGYGAHLGSGSVLGFLVSRNVFIGNSGPPESDSGQVFLCNFGDGPFVFRDSLVADGSHAGITGGTSDIQFTNLTVVNHPGTGMDVFLSRLDNSIVFGNGKDLDRALEGGNNLIGIDPFFVDAPGGDYRLLPGSPAIDVGNDAPPQGLGEFDLDSEDRIFGTGVDLGAYESSTPGSVQYLTQVGDGMAADIVLTTAVEAANVSDTEDQALTIDFFDPTGAPWAISTTDSIPAGEGSASSVSRLLKPGETWSIETAAAGEIQAGYARIRSGESVGITGIFTRSHAPTGTVLYQAGVPASREVHVATLFIDSLGDLETGLAVVNTARPQASPLAAGHERRAPSGSPGEIVLSLYDQQFDLVAGRTVELAAGEHLAMFVSQLFLETAQAAEMQGILTVESLDPITLVTLRQNDRPGLDFPDEVPTLAAFPVLEGRPATVGPSPQGPPVSEFFFAQIGNGQAGTIGLATSVNLVSQSDTTAPVQLDFFAGSGDPLVLTVLGLGTDSSFNLQLEPGESVVLSTDGLGALQAGYLRVQTIEGVGGSAVFSQTFLPQGILETESGVPASDLNTRFSILVDTSGDSDTGLALVNPETSPAGEAAAIQLSLLDMQGALIGTRELELGPGRHTAQFVTQLFADVDGIDGMRGLLTVSSSVPMAAVTLLQNDDPALQFADDVSTLTAFPVLSPSP